MSAEAIPVLPDSASEPNVHLAIDTGLHRHRWTSEDVSRMVDAGIVTSSARMELVEGEMIDKMPRNPPRATALSKSVRSLQRVFDPDAYIRVQLPLRLNAYNEPEPDIAVVTGEPDEYGDHHPGAANALLVLEISDSTEDYDRRTKSALYARAGVSEYWILTVCARTLEVYRNPGLPAEDADTFGYREVVVLDASQTVSPLAAPDVTLSVAGMLPSAAVDPEAIGAA